LGFWATDNPEAASDFAEWAARGGDGQRVVPVDLSFSNPKIYKEYSEIEDLINAHTKFKRPGMLDEIVNYDAARQELIDQGYDGIVLSKTSVDSPSRGQRINQYVAIKPGTVYNALTGELMYSNPSTASVLSLMQDRKDRR
jgi:hypothetical protein